MEDVDVKDDFIAIKEELPVPIKEEEIPQDITFPDINSEPDEVSYVCLCQLLDTFLPLSRNVIISVQLK
jgi:hypothetical protein